nr:PAS domain S-box protein [Sabulibacter ruber]
MNLWQSMIEHSMEPMLLTYVDGQVIYVNNAMCALIGKDKATLLKEGRPGIMDLSDPRLQVCLETRKRTGHFKGELLCKHADGTIFPVEVSTSAFKDPCGRMVASIHMRDLRPEKAAKQEICLRKSEMEMALSELQMVMDNTLDVICIINSEGKITQINAAGSRIWGYSPEELKGLNILNIVHPEDREKTRNAGRNVLQGASYHHYRNRYLHKNGSLVYMDWSTVFSHERQVMYCIGRDISLQVEAEQQKAMAEEKLKTMLQAGPDTVFIVRQDGTYAYLGPTVSETMGVPEESLLNKYAFDFFTFPEDRAAVEADFRKVLQGGTVTTKPYRFPSVHPQGWSWYEAVLTNCLDNPTIQGIVASVRDVSERYYAQVELHKSEQRYRSLFDHNPDAVYSLDTNGFFTSLNKKAIEMVGLPEEQILNRHFNDFAHPDFIEHNKQKFKQVLTGEPVYTETSIIDGKQQERYYTFTEIPILVNGEVVGVHGLAKDITQQKRQQQLLEETAQRLNNTLESIRDAFITIDREWRVTYLNQEFEKVLLVNKEYLLNRDIREIYPEEDFVPFYENCRKSLETQVPVNFEEYSAHLEEWVDVRMYPSENGISVFFKVITSKKNAEEELKKLSWVASKTVNSVYITDELGRIEWVNDGFTRITGFTLAEVKGRRPGDLLAGPETNSSKIKQIRKKLSFDKPFTQEVQNRRKDGELYWSKLDVTPILDEKDARKKKFIVIETVITEQKRAEQERIQLTEELLRRNRNLEQFTYIVSHNLRSPVANILGLTDLLNTVENPELQVGITSRLRQTAQNLDQIIRDLNEMLSLQAGVLQNSEQVVLPDVVEQALQVLPTDSFASVSVNLNGVHEIRSIRGYVSSILNNLLTNAVKYKSPDKPLELSIIAEALPETGMVCLSVTDNGLGIDLEKEGKNLFGLYKRFHFHVSGRGLGLYLVKTQAEALGGTVTVESKPNEGSTFRVWLKNLNE